MPSLSGERRSAHNSKPSPLADRGGLTTTNKMPKKIAIKPILGDGYLVRELAEIMSNFKQFDHIGRSRDPNVRQKSMERWLHRKVREGKVNTVPDSKPIKISDQSFSDLVKGKIDLYD